MNTGNDNNVMKRIRGGAGRFPTPLALLLFCAAVACGAGTWALRPQRQPLHLRVVASPYEPFAFQAGGVNRGLDVDLLNLVSSARGWTYDIEWVSFPEALARVQAGRADMAIGAIYVTEERRRDFLFTDPYLRSGLVLVTLAGRPARLPEGLSGLRVGVKRRATGETLAQDLKEKRGVALEAIPFESTDESFEALKAGRVDAVLNDYLNCVFIIHSRYAGEMVIGQGLFGTYFFKRYDMAFPMRMGLTGPCQDFNETLRQLKRGGVYGHILEQWLPQPPPVYWERVLLIAGGLGLFLLLHLILFFVYYRRAMRLKLVGESERYYRGLIEKSPLAIFIQREGTLAYANQTFLDLFGATSVKQVQGQSILGFIAEGERDRVARFLMDRSAGRPAPATYGTVGLRGDGSTFPAHVQVAPVELPDGPAHLVFVENFTEHLQAGEALSESEERFRTLAENTSAAIFIYQDTGFRYVNPATERISGYSRGELLQMAFWDLVHPDHRELVKERGMARQRGEAVPSRYEFKVVTKGGEERWVQFSAGTLELDGRPAALGTAFDITERKRAEDRLDHLAHYDSLTGLPNRLLFYERVGAALSSASKVSGAVAIVLLDLDRFKDVNDTLGHDVGDLAMQSVSRRLGKCCGAGATAARMGSDEFALLLPDLREGLAAESAARRILHDLSQPITVAGHEVHITASLGLSVYPSDGDDAATLLKNADIALLRAHSHGGNTFQFVTSDLSAQAAEQTGLKNRLRKAIEQQEFRVHYQPIFDLASGRPVAVEALVRWAHPELGVLRPQRFVPLAEETGLILPLGEWVLYAACAQNRAWQKAGFSPVRMGVNLSALQFQQPDLIETIALVLKSTGLEARYLELEITESAAMADMDNTVEVLRRLSDLGISIAIDDFGTGYSSLSYLKKFPIQQLKIDRGFVQDVPADEDNAAIVRAVVTMAHGLDLLAVAEGVETAEQLHFLREVGCDAGQGFYFMQPVPPEEIEELLRLRDR